MNLREAARGRDVFRCRLEHRFELFARRVEIAGFDECTAESDARRQVCGMPLEAGNACVDRLVEAPEAPVLFGQRRKRDRRRVRLDPAP